VRAAIDSFLPTVICLQESKLQELSTFLAASFLLPSLRTFVLKPSVGASGGIITAWNDVVLELTDHSIGDFSLTTTFAFHSDNLCFTIINVYGPCHDQKPPFLTSLEQAVANLDCPFAIMGDFNLIRSLPKNRPTNSTWSRPHSSMTSSINLAC
jgi:exonuclease III